MRLPLTPIGMRARAPPGTQVARGSTEKGGEQSVSHFDLLMLLGLMVR